ncbi:MAG TPA: hypothetical protein DF383_13120 [Deltaproteobacteria bacterium]|nr:hypothetical protein [Deltaproteobacteria bacterium]
MAESLPAESQATIQIDVGEAIKTAEGTTLLLEKVQIQYEGKAQLRTRWTVVSGPENLIQIQQANELHPRVVIGDLQQAAEWTLRLQVSDGKAESSAELKISALPAKLELVQRLGGAWIGVKRMGERWVAARGNEVEILGPELNSLSRLRWTHPIAQFLTILDKNGKGGVFVQAPEGNWALFQQDSTQAYQKKEFPMLGRAIRRVIPFEMAGEPYFFALLERGIELWNLSELSRPTLKRSLGAFLKNPLFLAFSQRNIYVAEEDSIHLIDFSTGNLIASIPSGGSVTALATYNVGEKNYLMAAIGQDRTAQKRQDYGLRLFEIDVSGRLGTERRVLLGEGLPIARAQLITGTALVMLSVPEEKGLSLRMVDLQQGKEIPLVGEALRGFLAIHEISTGRVNDTSTALIADGNQLKAFAFKPTGEPPASFTVTLLKSLPSIISAAWVRSDADGSRVWLGDEGTAAGGALTVLNGKEFQISAVNNAPTRTYPAHADFTSGGDLAPLLYLAEDLKGQGGAEGLLGLTSLNAKDSVGVELSKNLIGTLTPQGQLRGSGIAGRALESGLRIVVAVARMAGNIGGAGLVILEKAAAQAPAAFLSSELGKVLQMIPLQDARDVALSSDGKTAFVAAGTSGVLAVDLEKKSPLTRMSLGTEEWVADRVLLSHRGDLVLAAFINRATRKVLVKIFGVAAESFQMQEYGTLVGLPAVSTVEGVRAPRFALTEDDLYLFIPTQSRILSVYNLNNPAQPSKIAELEVEGEIRGVALANRFQDIFLALGPAGVAKLQFGF